MTRRASVVAAMWVVACGSGDGPSADASSGTTASSTTSDGGLTSDGPDASTTTTTTPSTSSSSDDATAGRDDNGFIVHMDGGPVFECDLFTQDCRPGEKCTLWADDGGSAWSATRCVPIVPDPAGTGEPCTVQDDPMSGLDDCDLGSFCWFVDDDLHGTCTDYCHGSAEAPECPEGYVCPISGAAGASLCLATCDLLASRCAAGALCVPVSADFACVPDMSEPGAEHGSPCEFVNACPAGMLCIGGDAHSNCAHSGCCSTVCDVSATDDPCPALDPGQSCEAWYPEGNAPAGYEDLGVCAIPV